MTLDGVLLIILLFIFVQNVEMIYKRLWKHILVLFSLAIILIIIIVLLLFVVQDEKLLE